MSEEEAILRITSRYVAEARAGKRPDVGDYIAQYPQYRDAIVDFVVYYHAVEAVVVEDAEPAPLSAASHAALEQVLRSLPSQYATKPMTSLLTTRTSRFTSSQLARQLDVSEDIVQLLEQRTIDPATVPYELCIRLAMTLHQPVQVVQAYLASSAQRSSDQTGEAPHLRVAERGAPYPAQKARGQSFRHIMEASALMSAEQRSRWCAILVSEGL